MGPHRITLYNGYGRPLPGDWWVLYYRVGRELRPMYWQQKSKTPNEK